VSLIKGEFDFTDRKAVFSFCDLSKDDLTADKLSKRG
jgi:hypothetical protein